MNGLQRLGETFFSWPQMHTILVPMIEVGLLNTIILSISAILLGTVLGMLLAIMLVSRSALIRMPARLYVDVFRGLPTILTILLIGEGLPVAKIRPFGNNAYPYAILALGLISAAFMSEVFRSGIESIERGQMEAARGLGLSHRQAMVLVVIPQGVRRVLPALTNLFVAIVKDSSLVYLLGLLTSQRELFSIAQDASNNSGNLSPMVLAGLFYLLLTVPLSHAVNVLDRQLRAGRPLLRWRRGAPVALRSTLEVG